MKRSLLTAAVLCFAVAASAQAQWQSDSTTNTAVCKASGVQDYPQACSDGADGVIVTWEDNRGSGWDIYAQRLDASGHAKWQTNGVVVCNNSSDQRFPLIAPDNNGGAYIVWQDHRTPANGIDLYGQHVNADGSLSYGSGGAAVAVAAQDQTNEVICSDGAGSAYVAWEDNRAANSTARPDIYLNRLTTGGVSWGAGGLVVDTERNAQRHPAICEDGSGGCYVGWESSSYIPNAIHAQRISSSGSHLWARAYGIEVFRGSDPSMNARNVNLRRDGSQVMVAWEVTNPNTSDGQDIYANRIRSDSTKVWFSSAEVTGDWFGDQTNPQVFSDDSTEASPNTDPGLMVIFDDYQTDSYPNYLNTDVAMVRVFSDGNTRMPTYPNGFFYLVKQAHGQIKTNIVKVDQGSVLAVWNDARAGSSDTQIYAQRVDRTLERYFPTLNTFSTWGEPLCVTTNDVARQVTLAPRTNGGIAAWTDSRDGNLNIYAQLIFKDGTLPIELATFDLSSPERGDVALVWRTTNERSNAGFDIQRRQIDVPSNDEWTTLASYTTNAGLRGNGTSSASHSYAYLDRGVAPGVYEYRLIDVDLNGTRTAHEPKTIDARDGVGDGPVWTVGAAQPNPFVASTALPITLASDALVDIAVVDVTGRIVATPAVHELWNRGYHLLPIESREVGGVNGNYIVRVEAYDPATGNLLWRSEHPTMLQLMK